MAKNENLNEVKLVERHEPQLVSIDDDCVTIKIPIHGQIDPKEGKQTHVVASGGFKVPRSDGKNVTLQVNAWYK